MDKNVFTRHLTGLLLVVIILPACSKDDKMVNSGTATIDNTLYGQSVYYPIGFSFDEGKELPLLEMPFPDITVHALTDNDGNVTAAYLDSPILVPPFALAGEFNSSQEAVTFYKNLVEVGTREWLSLANPVKENQVWIIKTTRGNYAKFRIISLVLENRAAGPFAEVKFEWKLQPDGSTTFGK